MRRTILYLAWRIVLATLLALAAMLLPAPAGAPSWLASALPALAVFLLVCYIGKLLYDTLFYDHFRP